MYPVLLKPNRQTLLAIVLVGGVSLIVCVSARAIELGSTTVPPTLEIEVLDPGVDPLDHPAIKLHEDVPGALTQRVEVMPTVLIHRYYYTGDRKFQAQLIPGGPSILVVQDPISNKQRYLQVTLPPGAPLVKYTGRSIEYDYGFSSVAIQFRRFGRPKVHHRSGRTISTTLSKTLNSSEVRDLKRRVGDATKQATADLATAVTGTVLFAGDGVAQVLTPVTRWIEAGPLSDIGQRLETRVLEHKASPILPLSRPEVEFVDRFPSP